MTPTFSTVNHFADCHAEIVFVGRTIYVYPQCVCAELFGELCKEIAALRQAVADLTK
jgi:hypothetical protein